MEGGEWEGGGGREVEGGEREEGCDGGHTLGHTVREGEGESGRLGRL